MKHKVVRILLVPALSLQLAGAALFLAANSGAAFAGFDEGFAAYERGDYATAFEEFSAAAEQSDLDEKAARQTAYLNKHRGDVIRGMGEQ